MYTRVGLPIIPKCITDPPPNFWWRTRPFWLRYSKWVKFFQNDSKRYLLVTSESNKIRDRVMVSSLKILKMTPKIRKSYPLMHFFLALHKLTLSLVHCIECIRKNNDIMQEYFKLHRSMFFFNSNCEKKFNVRTKNSVDLKNYFLSLFRLISFCRENNNNDTCSIMKLLIELQNEI